MTGPVALDNGLAVTGLKVDDEDGRRPHLVPAVPVREGLRVPTRAASARPRWLQPAVLGGGGPPANVGSPRPGWHKLVGLV